MSTGATPSAGTDRSGINSAVYDLMGLDRTLIEQTLKNSEYFEVDGRDVPFSLSLDEGSNRQRYLCTVGGSLVFLQGAFENDKYRLLTLPRTLSDILPSEEFVSWIVDLSGPESASREAIGVGPPASVTHVVDVASLPADLQRAIQKLSLGDAPTQLKFLGYTAVYNVPSSAGQTQSPQMRESEEPEAHSCMHFRMHFRSTAVGELLVFERIPHTSQASDDTPFPDVTEGIQKGRRFPKRSRNT